MNTASDTCVIRISARSHSSRTSFASVCEPSAFSRLTVQPTVGRPFRLVCLRRRKNRLSAHALHSSQTCSQSRQTSPPRRLSSNASLGPTHSANCFCHWFCQLVSKRGSVRAVCARPSCQLNLARIRLPGYTERVDRHRRLLGSRV